MPESILSAIALPASHRKWGRLRRSRTRRRADWYRCHRRLHQSIGRRACGNVNFPKFSVRYPAAKILPEESPSSKLLCQSQPGPVLASPATGKPYLAFLDIAVLNCTGLILRALLDSRLYGSKFLAVAVTSEKIVNADGAANMRSNRMDDVVRSIMDATSLRHALA